MLKRRWLYVEGCLISVALVWLITYGMFGSGTPVEVFKNIANWAGNATPASIQDIWYPNTYIPLRYVIGESPAPVNTYLSSDQVRWFLAFMAGSTYLSQGLVVLAAAAAWLRPEVVSPYRLTFLGLAIAMATSETSPYTQPLLFFFVFFERWQGVLRPLAIVSVYLASLPGDIHIGGTTPVTQFSFIADRYVTTYQGLTITMFARPFVFLMPSYFLALHTIVSVLRDIRDQGWSERWRFRTDWPLLPRIVPPTFRPVRSVASVRSGDPA